LGYESCVFLVLSWSAKLRLGIPEISGLCLKLRMSFLLPGKNEEVDFGGQEELKAVV
jgi:hypothetical protein